MCTRQGLSQLWLSMQCGGVRLEQSTDPLSPASSSHICVLLSGDGGQEHLSLAQQRLQLDRVRQDLPSGPVGLFSRAQGLAASSPSGKWPQEDWTLATGRGNARNILPKPPSAQIRGLAGFSSHLTTTILYKECMFIIENKFENRGRKSLFFFFTFT